MGSSPSYALPGELVPTVEAWIQGNPTLRPRPGERLVVNRTDSPALRFTFQASIFPVSGITPIRGTSIIRTERFSFFDLINGVNGNRMEESLREIYGPAIYSDYRRALPLYSYPNPNGTTSVNPDVLLQGEVREGELYAYWLEIASDEFGIAYSGRMAVFLKEDLPRLLEQLNVPPSDQ
ncbi:MAG TPA: hypothetical protein V6D07_05665 [Trichocoleus sp.]